MPFTVLTNTNAKSNPSYVPWSPEMQTKQLQQATVAFLPIRKGVEYKSPNRLVNAIRAGCFVVTDRNPSTTEFRRYIWTGNSFTGVKWSQHFRPELNDIVAEGQTYIEKFSPENVGKQWKQLLSSLSA